MAVHVYGVTAAGTERPAVKGRQDGDVRLVGDDALAVIVSDVDAEAPAGRKDLLAHAHVLEWFAEQRTVLPMRFGVALPSDDVVRQELLEDGRDSLENLLATFDGLVQVTVQAFHHEDAALREVLRRHPELLEAREQLRASPELATQGRQVDLGQAVAAALEDLQEEDRTRIVEHLAPLSRAVAEDETAALHEVAHAAFLVERAGRDAFDHAVGALGTQLQDRIRLRYVGPQPPYSFLDAAQSGELRWD